jgi:TM2 domain-containing membrane protein YozV
MSEPIVPILPQLPPQPTPLQEANSKKVAAGVCAIVLGSLGIHKFILGMNTAGLIMLLSTLLTCGLAAAVFHVVGLVEGILYLTKSDEEFYRVYIVGKKEWF